MPYGFSVGRGGGPTQALQAELSILAWNCRGMSNTETMSVLWGLVKFVKHVCVILFETKCG